MRFWPNHTLWSVAVSQEFSDAGSLLCGESECVQLQKQTAHTSVGAPSTAALRPCSYGCDGRQDAVGDATCSPAAVPLALVSWPCVLLVRLREAKEPHAGCIHVKQLTFRQCLSVLPARTHAQSSPTFPTARRVSPTPPHPPRPTSPGKRLHFFAFLLWACVV